MKYLLTLICLLPCFLLNSQTIIGGDIRNAFVGWDTLNATLTYDITANLHVSEGSEESFRFGILQQQRFAIYKGMNKSNLELINEYVVGGSLIGVTPFSEIPILSSCQTPSDNIKSPKLLRYQYRTTLPVISEDYYFVYEGISRDTEYSNIDIGAQRHFVTSTQVYGIAQQRSLSSYPGNLFSPIIWFNNYKWEDIRHCTRDTSIIDLTINGNEELDYEWNFYTPLLDWEMDDKVIYKTGYSAAHPLGSNYFDLNSDGKLKVFVETPGEFLIGICVTGYDKEDGTKLAQSCQEFTLQFYDCEPKVVAALANAEQNDQGTYILGSCETQIPLSGRNEGSLSSGAFQWNFQDENGANYPAFQRNPVFELPSFGTYTGQLNVEVEGCRDSVQVEINIGAAPESGLEDEYEVCDLPLVLEGNENVSFLWEDGSINPQREILQSGSYQLTVSDNCERTQNILVRNLSEDLPSYGLIESEDTTICLQHGYVLSINQDNLSNILWNGEAKTSLDIRESGNYRVSATTPQGCEWYDEIQVEVIDCTAKVYVPNAFSPNGDGMNDRFEISMNQAEIVSLRIFNRWGSLVYEGQNAWDGRFRDTPATEGLYVYQLEYYEPLLDSRQQIGGEFLLMY